MSDSRALEYVLNILWFGMTPFGEGVNPLGESVWPLGTRMAIRDGEHNVPETIIAYGGMLVSGPPIYCGTLKLVLMSV